MERLGELVDIVEDRERRRARGPIVPEVTPEEIRRHLASRYDFRRPLPLDDVIDDVERMLGEWQVQIAHPRYMGLFNPNVTAAGVIGDTLAAIHNPQLAAWRTSPAPNEIERHTLDWVRLKFGLPDGTAASFTSGGAEANLTAVVAALTHAFPRYGEDGLRGIPAQPLVYVSREAHHSFNKIAHMTGLGRRAIRAVATDPDLRMDLDELSRQLAADRDAGFTPAMVVGTAGTTAAGAIDPLSALGNLCRGAGLWFHVDAAWGGAAAISPRLGKHLHGIEAADSITCDAHKWFSVPMGAGMFFCRHAETIRSAFHAETSYMPRPTEGLVDDPYTTSVQWSRRFIGLKLFLALAERGERGYIDMIEHQARMGKTLRASLERSGWTLVNRTPLPLVCFTRTGLEPNGFLDALYRRQIAWISQVRLGNDCRPVLRACITNYRTTESDVERVVHDMDRVFRAQQEGM